MLKNVPFHIVYSTGENEPIEFFFDALLESKSFDLGLGFFSSTGINVLSAGFAYFIHKGGKMRVIINDVLSKQDKTAIEKGINKPDNNIEDEIINNISILLKTLSKQDEHFFKCLSFLIAQKRIEFIATIPANKKGGIAHSKYGIFTDENNNKVVFNGSANFSKTALLNNVESISCYKSWTESKSELQRLFYFEKIFNKTWQGKSKNIKIIPIEKVKSYIQNTFLVDDIQQLIDEENALITKLSSGSKHIQEKIREVYSKIENEPGFPFPSGSREYQKKAYENWRKNRYQGIFAMATGTGKTITALNCVLNEYKKNGKYNVLILVPTRALVSQWINEANNFNYQNINSTQEKNWFETLSNHFLNKQLGIDDNIIFISTYQSYNGIKFQRLMEKNGWKEFILIADESHNMGASLTLKNLPESITKRIGLSATPERIYDDSGSHKLYEYFNSNPPCYTYSYSMYKAIHSEPASLVKYFYYPYFSYLNDNELEEYKKITDILFKNYDVKHQEFNEIGKRLLIKRKRIINKAENKIEVLKEIFIDVHNKENNLKYTFVYVPEGKEEDYSNIETYIINEEDSRLINKYSKVINDSNYTTHQLLSETKNRDKILNQFAKGKIDVLLAMKILDEGVDIPVTKNAIFCSSTGNPRQYIQRRGRVLRKYKNKHYANIYDIIIAPQDNFLNSLPAGLKAMEIRIFQNELRRVANFLYAAENINQILNGKLGELSDRFSIDLITLINDNLDLDKQCE